MEPEIQDTFQCVTRIHDTAFWISYFILLNEILLGLVRVKKIKQSKQHQHDKDFFSGGVMLKSNKQTQGL